MKKIVTLSVMACIEHKNINKRQQRLPSPCNLWTRQYLCTSTAFCVLHMQMTGYVYPPRKSLVEQHLFQSYSARLMPDTNNSLCLVLAFIWEILSPLDWISALHCMLLKLHNINSLCALFSISLKTFYSRHLFLYCNFTKRCSQAFEWWKLSYHAKWLA